MDVFSLSTQGPGEISGEGGRNPSAEVRNPSPDAKLDDHCGGPAAAPRGRRVHGGPGSSRGQGGEMNKMRRMPRIAAVALAVLLLASPAPAAGWPAPFAPATVTVFERALQWWQGLWAANVPSAAKPAPQP